MSQKQHGLETTADLINASFVNKDYSGDVMGTLIRQAGPTLFGPELVAMICRLFNAEVVDQLPKIVFPSAIVRAAAHNSMYGKEVTALLFRRHGRCVNLDPEAIAAVYEVFADDMDMIELLHSRINAPSQVYIENGLAGLFEGESQDIAAAYMHCDTEGIAAMLYKYEGVITAEEGNIYAASNEVDARNVMFLLLDRFKGQYQHRDHVQSRSIQ
ncbi:uncharacterized protein BDV17DRAFT_266074 [Aspergillus undulatus]|uniref:uncharacterized protein n=1 Tax=Aspergillus undulatus TaxID=1810928 RepID=UPI003CCCAB35